MSKNDALELAYTNAFAGKAAFPTMTHWRLQIITASTDMEDDAMTVASYSGYAPVAVLSSELTVEEVSDVVRIKLNVRKEFADVAGSPLDIERMILQASADGSTYPYAYYSDADLNQTVAVGIKPFAEADTGFRATED